MFGGAGGRAAGDRPGNNIQREPAIMAFSPQHKAGKLNDCALDPLNAGRDRHDSRNQSQANRSYNHKRNHDPNPPSHKTSSPSQRPTCRVGRSIRATRTSYRPSEKAIRIITDL